jgi:hypothetical protein
MAHSEVLMSSCGVAIARRKTPPPPPSQNTSSYQVAEETHRVADSNSHERLLGLWRPAIDWVSDSLPARRGRAASRPTSVEDGLL